MSYNPFSFPNEDRETCIGCGENWYSKWFKEGFCQTCQKTGKYHNHKAEETFNRMIGYVVRAFFILLTLAGIWIIFG